MHNRRFTNLLVLLTFLLAATASCQKDPVVQAPGKSVVMPDTVKAVSISSQGNYLAASGVLKVTVNDSTYTFDAVRDSIAFINMPGGDTRYFGITAINKEHTMSFGISSAGFANSNMNSPIAGSQLLLTPDGNKPALQYSLSRYSGQKDFGNINIVQYNQGAELAKGSFVTFLAKDDKAGSAFYKVEGSFDLQLK